MVEIKSGAMEFVKWAQRRVNQARGAFGDRAPEVAEAMRDLDAAWEIYAQG